MNKVNFGTKLRIHNKIMKQFMESTNSNLEELIRAKAITFGVVLEKTTGGIYTEDCRVRKESELSIDINGGYCIWNLNNEIIIIKVDRTSIDLSEYGDGSFYITVVPKKSSYEEGILSFTNGSKTVSIAGGTFTKIYPFEYIGIYDSISGNNGLYKVANIGTSTIELTESFTGTTENNLPWKIMGYYGQEITPNTEDNPLYEYNDYDILITTDQINGICLAVVSILGAEIDRISDRRTSNLYKEKFSGNVNADSILNGINKQVTTIEEARIINTLTEFMRNFITPGVRSGGVGSIIMGNQLLLTEIYAYSPLGREVHLSATQINLDDWVADSQINEGTNYFYLFPSDYGSYSYKCFQTQQSGNVISIGKLVYNTPIRSPYSWEEEKITARLKSSIKLGDKPNDYSLGDLYFKDNKCFLQKQKIDNTGTEEVEIVSVPAMLTTLNYYIGQIRKEEKLRFSLYIEENKDSWFMFNGLCAPTLVTTNFRVLKFARIRFNVNEIGDESILAVDYMGKGTTPRYIKANAIASSVESVNGSGLADISQNQGVGVYFNSSTQKIQLIVGGQTLKELTADSNDGPFYVAEVDILPLEQLEILNTTSISD